MEISGDVSSIRSENILEPQLCHAASRTTSSTESDDSQAGAIFILWKIYGASLKLDGIFIIQGCNMSTRTPRAAPAPSYDADADATEISLGASL